VNNPFNFPDAVEDSAALTLEGAMASKQTSIVADVQTTERGEGDESPLISVIIVGWNARELLAQALSSLFEQTDQPSYEVIVVDNGSTDGSSDMIRNQWSQVKLISLTDNVGFAAGNNIGIEHATGEYILLLNSDTIVLPTTLRGLAAVLQGDNRIGCVGARHLNGDGSLQRSTNEFPTLLNDVLELTEFSRLTIVQRFLRRRFPWWGDHLHECDTGWVNGACMMVRKSVIDQIGGLDESFFIYAEEVEWCYRMRRMGWRVVFSPKAEVIHLSGHAFNSDPGRRLRLRFWGHAAFYRKHYSRLRHSVFRIIVTTTSAGRICGLILLKIMDKLGCPPSAHLWELVTQDSSRAPYGTMIRAWWKILIHAAAEPPVRVTCANTIKRSL
jgi:GT2 family glycosyltransferase